jgi:Leucine-rich repeat (LRR) protein
LLLHQVPESICALTTLTRLDLGECKVAKISPSISKLTRLRDLNLRYNYLYPEVHSLPAHKQIVRL